MNRFLHIRPRHRRREALAKQAECTITPSGADGPLSAELRALRDHADRIPWLAGREFQPEAYQQAAQEVVVALLAGWSQQRPGAVMGDLLPRFAAADDGTPGTGKAAGVAAADRRALSRVGESGPPSGCTAKGTYRS